MIALDTNVLVRLLVDDPDASEQNDRARALVDKTVDRGESIFLPDIVLCEFVWVLRKAYNVRRADIARALNDLLQANHIVLESPAQVSKAVLQYSRGPADFADYLITEIATSGGCERLYTFDAKVSKANSVEEP